MARAVLGDWQTGGNFTAQSGAPFAVNISSDQANIGSALAQRPNISGSIPRSSRCPRSIPSAPPPRNAVIGPGLLEFDLSLQKDIRLAEAYNLFNHPNINIPNRTAFTANFGSISSAQDSRQLQFALKLLF